ncbi:unnamed protein product, partial [marine sediment metagenome]
PPLSPIHLTVAPKNGMIGKSDVCDIIPQEG